MILRLPPEDENGEVISSARISNPSFPNAFIGNLGGNLDPRLKHSGVTFQGNQTFTPIRNEFSKEDMKSTKERKFSITFQTFVPFVVIKIRYPHLTIARTAENNSTSWTATQRQTAARHALEQLEQLEPMERERSDLGYITPAPLAHLYFAPSTATGSSVVYG